MGSRILFISIAFPPKADPECIQTARYFYYLSKVDGLDIDVVTSRNPTLFMPVDPTLQKYGNVRGQLVEVPIYESRYVNFGLKKLLPGLVDLPDTKMTFHWQSGRVVKQIKEVPDLIYSRSNPLSSTIMALKLSKKYNKPWIMHLSDPWTENALTPHADKAVLYHTQREKECFQQATVISFTSEKTAELYRNKYEEWAHKMTVFPNVYDPETAVDTLPSTSSSRMVRIVYTGGLANTRTAEVVLESLHLMVRRTPALHRRFEVLFAGELDYKNRQLFHRFSAPFIKHVGTLSSAEASILQRSAHLLLVIDSKVTEPKKAVFFPSKLLDYAILQRPILAITTPQSVTEEFVLDHGGVVFSHEQVDALANWLQNYIEGNITLRTRETDKLYAADTQASRLAELIKNVIA